MDPAGAVEDPAQRSSGQQPQQQQWDRFEVVLSKPSGSQKLGMVLKHAQVTISPFASPGCFEQPSFRRNPPAPPPAFPPAPPPPPPART